MKREIPKQRHTLEIYVACACVGCEAASHMTDAIRARALPNLDVRLIDLAAPGAIRPSAVFAVPTYLLDDRVVSLGNPEEGWLVDRLTLLVGDVASRGAG